jgi:hypothetical protein
MFCDDRVHKKLRKREVVSFDPKLVCRGDCIVYDHSRVCYYYRGRRVMLVIYRPSTGLMVTDKEVFKRVVPVWIRGLEFIHIDLVELDERLYLLVCRLLAFFDPCGGPG